MANLSDPNVLHTIVAIFIGFVCFVVAMVLFLRWLGKQPLPKKFKCTNCGRKFKSEKEGLDHFEVFEHESGKIVEVIK